MNLRSLLNRNVQHEEPEIRTNISRNKHVINLNSIEGEIEEIAKDIAYGAKEFLLSARTPAPMIITTRKVAPPEWWAAVSRNLPEACEFYNVVLTEPVMENKDWSANIVYIFDKPKPHPA